MFPVKTSETGYNQRRRRNLFGGEARLTTNSSTPWTSLCYRILSVVVLLHHTFYIIPLLLNTLLLLPFFLLRHRRRRVIYQPPCLQKVEHFPHGPDINNETSSNVSECDLLAETVVILPYDGVSDALVEIRVPRWGFPVEKLWKEFLLGLVNRRPWKPSCNAKKNDILKFEREREGDYWDQD